MYFSNKRILAHLYIYSHCCCKAELLAMSLDGTELASAELSGQEIKKGNKLAC